ncbi:MAG: phosphate ABC transporter permease PstA [bacterium]
MRRYWKSGDPFVWLTGGALAASLLMIFGLIALILLNGLSQFWPGDIVELRLKNGQTVLGEVWNRERIHQADTKEGAAESFRIRVKIGNRDIYPLDFRWIDEDDVEAKSHPREAIAIERTGWGNFYGYFKSLKVEGEVVASDLRSAWPRIQELLEETSALHQRIAKIEKGQIGDVNYQLEKLRLRIRTLQSSADSGRAEGEIVQLETQAQQLQDRYETLERKLAALTASSSKYVVTMVTADGVDKEVKLFDIVRMYRPNQMGLEHKSGLYVAKIWEFVSGEPRESNTEGGVFPAIFGTVMMVFLMSIAVVPLGVLAAIYLREYAKQGALVQLVRIAVNNLAGVPSIVYGVFGLGFFIYAIGGTIDQLFFAERLPTPTFGTGGILWASLTLALLTVPVVIIATEEGLAAVPREMREGSLALSATKFETLWRIVIPSALPGILTGLILAIARAAGEVAPLMITGVVKLAPSLPLDKHFPFFHLERKFMHLGFHIYDVGFQSPNVEAAIPMVYSTTLLLLLIVLLLNVAAIYVRNRLRKKLVFSVF